MHEQSHINGCLSGIWLLLLSLSACMPRTVTFSSKRSDYSFVLLFYYLSAGSITFHTQEAKAPPTNGPTMKIQRLLNAAPP